MKAYLLLATVFEHKKKYKDAYVSLYEALKHAKVVSDRMLLVNVYTVATQLHISANAYEKAVEFAETIEELANSPRGYCISYTQKLHALTKLTGNYPAELVDQASVACEEAKEPLMKYSISIFTADSDVIRTPEYVKATMQAALPELEQIGYLYTIIQAKYYLGLAHHNLNELNEARIILEQVYLQSVNLNDYQTSNKAMLLLAQLHEKNGDNTEAAIAYKQHIAALNSYIDEFKQRSVAYHLAQADFMESENKLALLANQNKLLQLESKLQQDEKLRTLLISIALLVLLLLVIFVLNSKRVALNRLATTDFLTRLFNRRYFNQAVSKHLANRRQQGEYSLIVFDIDLFKQINDQYGHAAGDKVLSAIAQCCQAQIRQQDILARIGGEEFALFLPGCGLTDAKEIAEQCRRSLEQLVIPFEDQSIQITASFGVAASSNADFDSLLKQADDALYKAKTGGRNRIMVHPSAASKGSSFA
ncbi:hypothetical protein WG68_12045 [Arsukibacterium ikkense]|uniref:diguanylate cyclase n=2 Tax=Arsukibacterium ikkense TaxID=336831 RepID=A0A0M2V7M8_9GAMM|nr:hypothetical protein WG68_12045 [Arsukibacterium ikkense]